MLLELAVSDLGVIDELSLVLGPGMSALTGETGAGKTLLVEAIELLVGGRADAVLVRPGAAEARIEGRFVTEDGNEVVLARVVPADGRSRAYVDGRLAPASALAEWGAQLVDLYGQHAHQSLLAAATQRAALDQFGSIDLGPLEDARRRLAGIGEAIDAIGGDARARAREVDLLRFQVTELDRAAVDGPDEDDRLSTEEDVLADATAHREASAGACSALADDGGATDALARALGLVSGRAPFASHEARLRSLGAELADVAGELRAAGEQVLDDPERLAEVRSRRQLLRDLRRKYGDTLADVLGFADQARQRLAELESWEARAARLDAERATAVAECAAAAATIGRARRDAAPRLAAAVEANLTELAMPRARLAVQVGDDGAGDDVEFHLAANAGAPLLPLAKVASGGELARAMLALRLVLSGASDDTAPPTLVFDEVDSGIGGRAALSVGRALAALASARQVLVVTHLPQVAAFADTQVAVTKREAGGRSTAEAEVVSGDDRLVELSRMLSGQPASAAARSHAAELLATAQEARR